MLILDTTKAYDLGYLDSLGGLFRGEEAVIIRVCEPPKDDSPFSEVIVTLPNSLNPEKEYRVSQDCLIV